MPVHSGVEGNEKADEVAKGREGELMCRYPLGGGDQVTDLGNRDNTLAKAVG